MDMIRVQTMKEKDQNAPLDEEDEDDADEDYEGDEDNENELEDEGDERWHEYVKDQDDGYNEDGNYGEENDENDDCADNEVGIVSVKIMKRMLSISQAKVNECFR